MHGSKGGSRSRRIASARATRTTRVPVPATALPPTPPLRGSVPNAASANAYPMTGHPTQTSREIRTIMSIQMLSTVQIADILPTNKVVSYCIDLESPMPVRTYPNTTTLHQIHTNVALVLTLPAVYINVSWNASSHRDHTWEHPGLHYLRFSSHLQFKLVVVV